MNTLTDLLGTDDQPWMNHPDRPCATGNPDRFFAPYKQGIKDLCTGCPVRTECLTYALDHPELEGVWGGLTDGQRATLRDGKAA